MAACLVSSRPDVETAAPDDTIQPPDNPFREILETRSTDDCRGLRAAHAKARGSLTVKEAMPPDPAGATLRIAIRGSRAPAGHD